MFSVFKSTRADHRQILRAVGLNVVLEISESCVLFETFSKGI